MSVAEILSLRLGIVYVVPENKISEGQPDSRANLEETPSSLRWDNLSIKKE